MEWDHEAGQAVNKIPFFVRRRVRQRVEEEARNRGESRVTMRHVQACRERFLNNQEKEVRGFQLETCFGADSCPNRIDNQDHLFATLEKLLASRDLKSFFKRQVQGSLKLHHEFRVSISHCPNGCSRPQIVDLGIIGACRPMVSAEPCSRCGACVESCQEQALELAPASTRPRLDLKRCLACGQCLRACPTSTLAEADRGYRLLVGGKLGRHPQLARQLPGIFSPEQTVAAVAGCLDYFLAHNHGGERFGTTLNRAGLAPLCATIGCALPEGDEP